MGSSAFGSPSQMIGKRWLRLDLDKKHDSYQPLKVTKKPEGAQQEEQCRGWRSDQKEEERQRAKGNRQTIAAVTEGVKNQGLKVLNGGAEKEGKKDTT